MKKLFGIALILTASLSMTSCEDLLVEAPVVILQRRGQTLILIPVTPLELIVKQRKASVALSVIRSII